LADDVREILSPAPPGPTAGATGKAVAGTMIGLGFLFGLLYFVQGVAEPTEGLLAQPTKSLLRHWEHSAASAAWFAAALSVPWAIKPLYGLLIDFVPLAGSRRRSYLLLTTAVTFVGTTAIYFLPLSSDKATLLLVLLLLPAVAIAFSDVVVDALMVEVGQPRGMTGRLQSIQWACIYAAMIFTGLVGGALSQWGVQQLGFLIAGLACGVSLLAVWFLAREHDEPAGAPPPSLLVGTGRQAPGGARLHVTRAIVEMWKTLREPGILAIGAFLFLWSFNPFSATVLYYYSTATLQFSEQFVGTLQAWLAVGGLAGSVLYGIVCRMIPVPWLIHGSIISGILATLAYWGYRDPISSVLVSVAVGIAIAVGSLTQLDLAARLCRPETAGTTFALLMSLTNLSLLLAQGVGGSIYEVMAERWGYGSAFQVLVALGALFTAACWLLMPLLRRAVIRPLAGDGAT
jgi:MFS family permease